MTKNIIAATLIFIFISSFAFSMSKIVKENKNKKPTINVTKIQTKPKVTFIELGAGNCTPCRMMEPILEKVEKKYQDQVDVIFYDIGTKEGKPFAKKYRIRVIPTQIFLDETGKEYYRHEGFFPIKELEKILKLKGVK